MPTTTARSPRPGSSDSTDLRYTVGSKDILDFPSNGWDSLSVPDKDDILDAYAALYEVSGKKVVTFGLDRFANNGDANVGFWFFQDDVSPVDGGGFAGHRTVGDVFVVSEFTSGGQLSTIHYYKWNGNGLTLQPGGVECDTGVQVVCAIANTSATDSPWPYTPKAGASGTFPTASFFEGGLNLDVVFPNGAPCFSTFMAETRASSETTAQLKNFVSGSFDTCKPPTIETHVQQDGSNVSAINKGESVVDVATFSGGDGKVTGKADFFVCGPSQSKPDCSSGGTKVGDTKTISDESATSDAFKPSALGWYCFRVHYTPDAAAQYLEGSHTNDTTECFRVIPADVQIVKTPNDGTVSAGDQISFSLSWTNEGEGKATGVVVSDDLPAGGGFDWSISGSTGTGSTCAITGNVGSQVVTCTIGSIVGNPNFPNAAPVNGTVTVVSNTSKASCGVVDNTGKITSDNDGTDTDPGKITVECPDVTVTKTPDGGSVDAGDDITWAIKVENLGPGTATGVTAHDPLPAGIDWSESEADCSISGVVGSEVLDCSVPGTMASGASKTYHVSGTTDKTDCGVVDNTATVSATNEPTSANGNNSDPGDVTVKCADIQIEKTAKPAGPVMPATRSGSTSTSATRAPARPRTSSSPTRCRPTPA